MKLWRPAQRSERDAENEALREALRASHAARRSLLDSVPEAFVQLDPRGTVLEWNAAAEQTFGWTRAEAVGRSLTELIIPERERDRADEMFRAFTETGHGETAGRRVECAAVRKDGREIEVELTVGAEQLPEGLVFNAFAHDIADRRRRVRYLEAQRRLALECAAARPLEESWEPLLEAIGEPMDWDAGAVWLLDDRGEELHCTEFWSAEGVMAGELEHLSRTLTYRRGYGSGGLAWERDEIVWVDNSIAFGTKLPRLEAAVAAGLRSGVTLPLYVGGAFAGTIEFFSRSQFARDDELAELMRLTIEQVGQFLQRSRAESALARTAEQLAEAQAIAEVGSWEWQIDSDAAVWSEQNFRIYGLEPTAVPPNFEGYVGYIHPDDRHRVGLVMQHTRETHEPFDCVHRVVRPDGTVRVVRDRGHMVLDDDGQARAVLGTTQDITAFVEAEERLRETQKLESLGVLAGGIAHDFNNLLVGILGNANLARDTAEPGSELDRLLHQIEVAGERAAELARQMLAYSGRGVFAPARRDLAEAVTEITQLLEAVVPENVEIDLSFGAGVPPVEADPGQLTQVLMNLITNAAEAVGTEPGTVRVSVELREIDAATLATFAYADGIAPGPYVAIDCSDTGAGMPEETIARIFEPFFTTKFSGRGLGLAAVLGIVRRHGGAVRVRSTVGQGTTFTVIWPPAA